MNKVFENAQCPINNWIETTRKFPISLGAIQVRPEPLKLVGCFRFWEKYRAVSEEWTAREATTLNVCDDVECGDSLPDFPDEIWVMIFESRPRWCPLSFARVSMACKRFSRLLRDSRLKISMVFPCIDFFTAPHDDYGYTWKGIPPFAAPFDFFEVAPDTPEHLAPLNYLDHISRHWAYGNNGKTMVVRPTEFSRQSYDCQWRYVQGTR